MSLPALRQRGHFEGESEQALIGLLRGLECDQVGHRHYFPPSVFFNYAIIQAMECCWSASFHEPMPCPPASMVMMSQGTATLRIASHRIVSFHEADCIRPATRDYTVAP